jgi:hypothetical protein
MRAVHSVNSVYFVKVRRYAADQLLIICSEGVVAVPLALPPPLCGSAKSTHDANHHAKPGLANCSKRLQKQNQLQQQKLVRMWIRRRCTI